MLLSVVIEKEQNPILLLTNYINKITDSYFWLSANVITFYVCRLTTYRKSVLEPQ